jgi:SpoVK/Ycf46/Vps4 family AAA+-type ATPase
LGILTKGTFKKVTRSDLVAGYLGQTAIKTKDVVKECLGGVLFIDEAYSLGNQEKRDSFSKECIDTLCEALSDYKDNLMVIIAGYETDLNDCFFKYNQGLSSRFTWRFKIDDYNAAELYNIFIKKINDSGWIIDNSNMNVKWFEKNKGLFKFYGRDIETLFAKTKIAHSRRVFCLDVKLKKILTMTDIDKGLEIYVKNGIKRDEDDENRKKLFSSMYS